MVRTGWEGVGQAKAVTLLYHRNGSYRAGHSNMTDQNRRRYSSNGKEKSEHFQCYVILRYTDRCCRYIRCTLSVLIILLKENGFIISKQPFELPKGELFAGLTNYTNGLEQTGLIEAAWILRSHNDRFRGTDHLFYIDDCLLCDKSTKVMTTSVLYYLFVFSMVVPFQMVMFTMVKT